MLFVFHGRIREAVQLLSQHEQSETKPFAIIIHLLNKMPVFTVSHASFMYHNMCAEITLKHYCWFQTFSGQSLSEFDTRWRHWQDDCDEVLQQGEFASHAELNDICRVRPKCLQLEANFCLVS